MVRLNDRIKQLIGFDFDIIDNRTGIVELIAHTVNANNKKMTFRFRE